MARKRIKKVIKPSIRRLIITAPICLFLIAYSLYTISSYALKIYNLNQQEKVLKTRLVSLKETKDELQAELVKLKDPDYLAKYARENYLYSKNNEYIIKIDDTEEELTKVKHEFNKTMVIAITVGGIILVTIIVIIPKKDKSKKKNHSHK